MLFRSTLAAGGITGLATGAGQLIGQATEVAKGIRESISPGEIGRAAITGAAPMAPFMGLSGPIKAAVGGAIKQAFLNQTFDALGRVFDTAYTEGRLPYMSEITDAASQLSTYLPGAAGGVAGGAAGFTSRPLRPLTEREMTGVAGTEAAAQLEARGIRAPLTAAQQTGRGLPGEFTTGSGAPGAQERVQQQVRAALGPVPAGAGIAAEQGIEQAGLAESQYLQGQIAGSIRGAEAAAERQLQTLIPGSARAATTADSANAALTGIRNEEQRLSQNVAAEYNLYQDEMNRLGAAGMRFMPTNLQQAVDDVLSSLATVQRTRTIPSPIVGGTPTVITTQEPTALFDQATTLARNLREVSRNPQTVEGLIGLRQQVDGIFNDITEIAPGFRRAQLTRLRDALKQDELSAARSVGGNAETLLRNAQGVAQNRFETLERNPIILKILKGSNERGSYQNSETLFSDLAKSPEGLDAIRAMSTPAEFNNIRRGLFDSLRDLDPVVINGIEYENAGKLANSFRNLPQETRSLIAGDAASATRLQSILDDVNRAQRVGGSVPVYGATQTDALNRLATDATSINDPAIRAQIINNVNQAQQRAAAYQNDITRMVAQRNLNPNVANEEFIRNFLFRSNNQQVVNDALALLPANVQNDVRRQAAGIFIDEVIQQSLAGRKSINQFVRDQNRLNIVRGILNPADFQLAENLMNYNRALLSTGQPVGVNPRELAELTWRVKWNEKLIDSAIGNPAMQNFIANVWRLPRQVLTYVKPQVSRDVATAGATAFSAPVQEEIRKYQDYYDQAKQSLPEDKKPLFVKIFGDIFESGQPKQPQTKSR